MPPQPSGWLATLGYPMNQSPAPRAPACQVCSDCLSAQTRQRCSSARAGGSPSLEVGCLSLGVDHLGALRPETIAVEAASKTGWIKLITIEAPRRELWARDRA
jgi:hypothetical protein